MTTSIRAFIAVDLPAPVRQAAANLVEVARRELPGARWVAASNLHLTVKFLGDTVLDHATAIATEVGAAIHGIPPVSVRLGGGGFFPSRDRPRVAWIGGEAPGLDEVARLVDRVASRHGIDRERRAWSPHLTVARLRRPWPRAAVERFVALADDTPLPAFECGELVLFSSRLDPAGAVYTPRERIQLG